MLTKEERLAKKQAQRAEYLAELRSQLDNDKLLTTVRSWKPELDLGEIGYALEKKIGIRLAHYGQHKDEIQNQNDENKPLHLAFGGFIFRRFAEPAR